MIVGFFVGLVVVLDEASDGGTKNRKIAIAIGLSLACVCLLIMAFGFLLWWKRRNNQQVFFDMNGKINPLSKKKRMLKLRKKPVFF